MSPANKNYDKKIFRLIAILNRLETQKTVSSRELSEEFNVHLRSVQRDIELLNQTGFPLVSVNKGSYAFMEGFSLKRLMISNEEATLMAFLYDITKSLGDKFEIAFKGMLNKVIGGDSESPFYVKMPKGIQLKRDYPFLDILEKAVEDKETVKIEYQAPKEALGSHSLKPLKIICYEGFWYLLASTVGKEQLMKFRLDRIKTVELIGDPFHAPSNLMTLLDESVNIWFPQKRDKKVVLEAASSIAEYFKHRKYFPLQKIVRVKKDGSLEIESMTSNYEEVIPTIMHWIPNIRVLSPKILKEKVAQTVKEYLSTIGQ